MVSYGLWSWNTQCIFLALVTYSLVSSCTCPVFWSWLSDGISWAVLEKFYLLVLLGCLLVFDLHWLFQRTFYLCPVAIFLVSEFATWKQFHCCCLLQILTKILYLLLSLICHLCFTFISDWNWPVCSSVVAWK